VFDGSINILEVISIKYSAYVSEALVIQHAHKPCYIAIYGVSGCTVFSTLSHK